MIMDMMYDDIMEVNGEEGFRKESDASRIVNKMS